MAQSCQGEAKRRKWFLSLLLAPCCWPLSKPAKERAQGKRKLPCFCSTIPALVAGLLMAIEFEISGLAGVSMPVPAPAEPKRPGARAPTNGNRHDRNSSYSLSCNSRLTPTSKPEPFAAVPSIQTCCCCRRPWPRSAAVSRAADFKSKPLA